MVLSLDPLESLGVSRETTVRLEALVALMKKWNPVINLVSKATIADAWKRHILDSAQIFSYADVSAKKWMDLGSGAGFPGLVVAVISAEMNPGMHVTLVEADQRKATFLREASRELGLVTSVIAKRIEALPPEGADVLSARALAPLEKLCGFAARHLAPGGTALFLKGANYQEEMELARKNWKFEVDLFPSATDAQAIIIRMKDLHHV